MKISEKTDFNTSIRHIKNFSKSGQPIYNSEAPDTIGREATTTTRARTQTISRCYAFDANVITGDVTPSIMRNLVIKEKFLLKLHKRIKKCRINWN